MHFDLSSLNWMNNKHKFLGMRGMILLDTTICKKEKNNWIIFNVMQPIFIPIECKIPHAQLNDLEIMQL